MNDTTPTDAPILRCEGLRKSFGNLEVLKGIDLDVKRGDRIAIIGGSGSGKSTFLRCLNFMEQPTGGKVILDGERIGTPRTGRDGSETITYRFFCIQSRARDLLFRVLVSLCCVRCVSASKVPRFCEGQATKASNRCTTVTSKTQSEQGTATCVGGCGVCG